jgi:hypothetical protein
MKQLTDPPALVCQAAETDEQIVTHCKEAMAVADRSSWDVADDHAKLAREVGAAAASPKNLRSARATFLDSWRVPGRLP